MCRIISSPLILPIIIPKTPQRHLTHPERAQIHALRHKAKWPLKKIGQSLRIPVSTVSHCINSHQITPTKPHGRHPILTTPIRQRLVEHATASRKQRLKPFKQVAQELSIQASSKTIYRAFKKEGYHRRIA